MPRTRLNELDLLRFVAALAVVFFHYSFRGHAADSMSVMDYPLLSTVFRYGYLGVELFFMLSGFVVVMSAAQGGGVLCFAKARLVRLYPVFWLACTITFLATLLLGGARYHVSPGQYLVNMTMLNGFVGVRFVDGVYWSLLIEMRFYLLLAALIASRRLHQLQHFLAVWLACTVALLFIPTPKLNYWLISEYAVFFIAGATGFLIWQQGVSRARLSLMAGAWILAVLQSVAYGQRVAAYYRVPMNSAVVAVVISLFFGMILLVALRRTGRIGRIRWLVLGQLTYPLYLLHQHIGYMLFNAAYPAVNRHLLFWGTIMAMLLLSYVVYRVVEKWLAPALAAALDWLAERVVRLAVSWNWRFTPWL